MRRVRTAHCYPMLQIAYAFAFFGAAFLLVAAAAWWKIARTPEKEEAIAVHSFLLDSRRVRSAAMATAVAFGLSGIAAILAILGMFTTG